MTTKFWRFSYDKERLKEILNSEELEFPDLSRWPLAKNNSKEGVVLKLKVGHFVLLANFELDTRDGFVKGVGKITRIEGDEVEVEWKRPVPSWSLTPNVQGGVKEWTNEGVFCFSAEPAKRYKLQQLTSKLFA